jgi:hypothetical protein
MLSGPLEPPVDVVNHPHYVSQQPALVLTAGFDRRFHWRSEG